MSDTDPKYICPNCSYDLANLPTEKGISLCPECGKKGKAMPADLTVTAKDLHKYLFVNSFLGTTLPVLFLFLMQLWFPLLGFIGCVAVPVMPFVYIYIVASTVQAVKKKCFSSHRELSTSNAVLLALLYSIPGLVVHILYLGQFIVFLEPIIYTT